MSSTCMRVADHGQQPVGGEERGHRQRDRQHRGHQRAERHQQDAQRQRHRGPLGALEVAPNASLNHFLPLASPNCSTRSSGCARARSGRPRPAPAAPGRTPSPPCRVIANVTSALCRSRDTRPAAYGSRSSVTRPVACNPDTSSRRPPGRPASAHCGICSAPGSSRGRAARCRPGRECAAPSPSHPSHTRSRSSVSARQRNRPSSRDDRQDPAGMAIARCRTLHPPSDVARFREWLIAAPLVEVWGPTPTGPQASPPIRRPATTFPRSQRRHQSRRSSVGPGHPFRSGRTRFRMGRGH